MKFTMQECENQFELVVELPEKLTAKEALKVSIKKWEFIVKFLENQIPLKYVDDGGINSCGLCQRYYDKNCLGCPVAESTGHPYCENTPYTKFSHTNDLLESLVRDDVPPPTKKKGELRLKYAKAELEFLKGLKP